MKIINIALFCCLTSFALEAMRSEGLKAEHGVEELAFKHILELMIGDPANPSDEELNRLAGAVSKLGYFPFFEIRDFFMRDNENPGEKELNTFLLVVARCMPSTRATSQRDSAISSPVISDIDWAIPDSVDTARDGYVEPVMRVSSNWAEAFKDVEPKN